MQKYDSQILSYKKVINNNHIIIHTQSTLLYISYYQSCIFHHKIWSVFTKCIYPFKY